MLTLLAAAMSTLSGQFHVIGSAIGRDVYQQAMVKGKHQERTVPLAKLGIFFAFVLTMVLSFKLPPGIVAVATALFFGMCAVVFLPTYVAALFFPRATRNGVIAGMISGLVVWGLWVLLVHEKESSALGICQALFNTPSLAKGTMWAMVDPIVIGLPISSLVTWLASWVTKPLPEALLQKCFGTTRTTQANSGK
jgi:SSS family solute:Na+ symporter